jgi:hypothetical protein
MLPLPIFVSSSPLRSSSSCLHLLPHLPVTSVFSNVFWKAVPMQDVTNPCKPSFLLLYVGYSCPPWLCSTSSFFTWSVQLISILLQYHISPLSRYFWSTFQNA